MAMREKKLVIVPGPTAVGKTSTCIKLAKNYDSEIISADSRQFYRELKIGTAAPTWQELNEIPHHLVGHLSVTEYYNASMFEQDALGILKDLFQKHDIVFMTGGSGLYINAVCDGIDDLPRVDPEIRQNLLSRLEKEGLESLRKELKILDPGYYKIVDLKNPKRILKGLEISIMTGKPYSSFLTREKKERPFSIQKIGLNLDREELYQRINQRAIKMVEDGLVEEAGTLLPYKNLNALNTVGYKEIFAYLDGQYTLNQAIDLIQRNTRRYARKQITWFRKDPAIQWFAPSHLDAMNEAISR